MHPRTANNLKKFKLNLSFIHVLPPLSHQELVNLIKQSEFVITDSGGIQEEAAFLGRVTFTMRDNTERPATIKYGLNKLVTPETLPTFIKNIPLWDGQAATRIVEIIRKL